jgi:hypothetical protein
MVKPVFTVALDDTGAVVKAPGGRTVLKYVTSKPADSKLTANSACFLHPICTPSGEVVTDLAPDDHRHHRGAFLAWYAMRGEKDADFWGWGQFAPVKDRAIVNRSVERMGTDTHIARLRVRNDWVADGTVMIQEETRIEVHSWTWANTISLTYRLTPTADVKLDQSAFGGFCVRLRKDGRLTFFNPEGEVKLPDPHYLKPETDWPQADWYACTIELKNGKTIGLAVINCPFHPESEWHNNRGAWMVNPCITTAGPVVLKEGVPLELRYCVVAFDGPVPVERLKALAEAYEDLPLIRTTLSRPSDR